MKNVWMQPGSLVLAVALVLGISTASHANNKSAFNVDLDALYGSLASSIGAPFAVGADLDGEEGADAQQDEFVEFNQLAGDDSDPDHEDVHDGWIDNFLTARNALRDSTALSNAVIDEVATVIGAFMTIQTDAMATAMESLWENTLGVTDPSFTSLTWVQAPHFEGGHDHEGEEEGEHDHEGEDDHDHDHDHDHDASALIKYFYEVGDSLIVEIPGPVDENEAIQWYFNGVAMQDLGGLIIGTQSAELELYALSEENSGSYSVTYTMGEEDDHDHEGEHDHDHEGEHDHDHKGGYLAGVDSKLNKSNATFSFTIQVVDPEDLPASRPYTLLLLVFAISIAGAVLYVRRVRA